MGGSEVDYLPPFLTNLASILRSCIFLRRWANLVAGLRGELRGFFGMAGLRTDSTGFMVDIGYDAGNDFGQKPSWS